LLSYLARQAILAALEVQPQPEIIRPDRSRVAMLDPDSGEDKTIAALPNTVVLAVEADKEKDIGEAMESAARAAWQRLTDEVRAAISTIPSLSSGHCLDIWKRQVEHHWEYYHAWGADSAGAFVSLAARKGLRDFPASELTQEWGDRCTVCGIREALRQGDARVPPAPRALRTQWEEWAEKLQACCRAPRTLLRPRGRERLCAVCLIKRLIPWTDNAVTKLWSRRNTGDKSDRGRQPAAFPSTSTMATVLYRVELIEAALKDSSLLSALRSYVQAIGGYYSRADSVASFDCWQRTLDGVRRDGGGDADVVRKLLELDGDWYLYGDAVRHEYEIQPATASKIGEAYRHLRKSAAAARAPDPPIYWALLKMDGDDMGERMSDFTARGLAEAASKVLHQFAGEAYSIIRKHSGRTVYAGGDEILAFLPLETALAAADELRRTFARFFAAEPALTKSKVSLSGAIVYAHHQAPLGAVIRQAAALLEQTKRELAPQKNGVGLQRYLRGGPGNAVVAPWEPFSDLLNTAAGRFAAEDEQDLGRGVPYALREQAWLLGPEGLLSPGAPPAGEPSIEHSDPGDQAVYLSALVRRSRLLDRVPEQERDARASALAKELLSLCSCATRTGSHLSAEPLLIARFLAGGGREER
jgi:CRISPR-associated protein Cmr2